ncbi:hypothetical protein KCP73_20425 [Salmonella enterica subsp. enterica]|nr:hypothetical protein KCP73_20425 [Salmonella enterica subsp. enterica]
MAASRSSSLCWSTAKRRIPSDSASRPSRPDYVLREPASVIGVGRWNICEEGTSLRINGSSFQLFKQVRR